MNKKKIIIGSRGSILAVRQSEIVVSLLKEKNPNFDYEIKIIKTSGDINLTQSMYDESLKNMFVKEIEIELLNGDIDLAVHSLKDMPLDMPSGLILGAVPFREDNRDVFISLNKSFVDLDENSVIGCSSIRRKCQIELLNNKVNVKEIRGNIHTRIEKLDNGEYDGIVLAYAGLSRTNLLNRVTSIFTIDEVVPAPGQGALCIQCRDDDAIKSLLSGITDHNAMITVYVEREFSRIFDGGCKSPVGAAAFIKGQNVELTGMIAIDNRIIKESVSIDIENYRKLPGLLSDIIRSKI